MVSGGWHEGMEGGKEGWREPSWGWEEPARWQEGPKGHAWVDGASSLPPKEKRSEAGSSSSCLCFPLRFTSIMSSCLKNSEKL